MPIYEFQCNKCGKCFEQLVFPSDGDDKYICPSCGKGDTDKLMSSFACITTGNRALSCGASEPGDPNCTPSPGCSSSSGGFS
jgi:putative FmdB family regulatory protein